MASNEEMLHWNYQRLDRIENQHIPALPAQVWAVTVKRGGVNVSALQELANTNTSLIEVHRKLDAILAKLNEGA